MPANRVILPTVPGRTRMPGLSALERNRPACRNAQVTSACTQYGIRKSRCQRSGCAPDLPVIGVSF